MAVEIGYLFNFSGDPLPEGENGQQAEAGTSPLTRRKPKAVPQRTTAYVVFSLVD